MRSLFVAFYAFHSFFKTFTVRGNFEYKGWISNLMQVPYKKKGKVKNIMLTLRPTA